MDFGLIARAGLTQTEFARACDVARPTVNLWVNKKMKPHRYIKDRVVRVLDRLEAAVNSGELPTTKESEKERSAAIAAVLNRTPA